MAGRLPTLEQRVAWLTKRMRQITPISGIGTNVGDSPTGEGRNINISASGGGGVGESGPWALEPGDTNKVRVVGNHPLRYSQVMDDIVTIIDVDNDFTPAIDDLFYLDIAYDGSYGIDSVTLTFGSRWANYSFPYTTTGAGTLGDPFIVQNAYYLIGYGLDPEDDTAAFLDGPTITLADDSTVKVVRCCYAPLLLSWQNMGGGFVIPYPEPPSMPGPPA